MNWKELKDFCNSLDEEQLNTKVVLLNDEECISEISTSTIDEDIYTHNDDDDENGTLEELQEALGEDFDINDFTLRTKKGTPCLFVNEN